MALIPLTQHGPENGRDFECEWSNTCFQAHFISDVGRKRVNNEDSCLFCIPQDETLAKERGLLFAVADGMGGASAGELASRLALSTASEEFYSGRAETVPIHLREALEAANARVYSEAEENMAYRGMGTTLSALLVLDDAAYVAHVGDSRVYLSRDNMDLLQVTEDHSIVAEQVRSGIISEKEARSHSMKNLITRAIGIREQVQVDLLAFRLLKGDTILLCSDGLNNMVEDRDIEQVLRMNHLKGAARVLVGKALEEGGSDNITVGLIRVVETPPKANLQEGCKQVALPSTGLVSKLKRLMP